MEPPPVPAGPPPPPIGNAAIRSRVTVVCTECKRLKLKCDRRTPCGSCIKRDAASKCEYSVEAKEKIDVQSLHNRVLLLEHALQVHNHTPASSTAAPSPSTRSLVAYDTATGRTSFVYLDDLTSVWLDILYPAPTTLELAPLVDTTASVHLPDRALSGAGPTASCLLERLPPESMRATLLDTLDGVLRLHSALHFPHLRARLAGPPHPTWSFMALASAAWALSAQAWIGSHRGEHLDRPWEYDPDVLITQSEDLTLVAERSRTEDVDYVHALLLQILFRLNDNAPRCHSAIYTTISKAVTAARAMGLSVDPSDKMPVFEVEARRRCWWDIIYFDQVISEALGHPPFVLCDTYTTTVPAECDDSQFEASSAALPPLSGSDLVGRDNTFSVLRCRLIQLIKTTYSREAEPALEHLQQCQNQLQAFLTELPPALRLDSSVSCPSSSPSSSPSQPDDVPLADHALLIPQPQRAAILHLLAYKRVLELMLPLARKSTVQHHALFASVNAACWIVGCARLLLHGSPGVQHHAWARAAFVGGAACTWALLRDGTAIWSAAARDSAREALALFDGPPAKALRMLIARSRAPPAAAGRKRKRGDASGGGGEMDDEEEFVVGEALPFLGTGVRVATRANANGEAAASGSTSHGEQPAAAKKKERESKGRPQLAVRVRHDSNAGPSKVKTEPSTPIVGRRDTAPTTPAPAPTPVPIRPGPSRRQSVSVVPQQQHQQRRPPTPQGYIAPPPQQTHAPSAPPLPPPLPPPPQPTGYTASPAGYTTSPPSAGYSSSPQPHGYSSSPPAPPMPPPPPQQPMQMQASQQQQMMQPLEYVQTYDGSMYVQQNAFAGAPPYNAPGAGPGQGGYYYQVMYAQPGAGEIPMQTSRPQSMDLSANAQPMEMGAQVQMQMQMRGPGISGPPVNMGGQQMHDDSPPSQVSGDRAGSSTSDGSSGPGSSKVWSMADNTRFSRWTFSDDGWQETVEDLEDPNSRIRT